MTKTIKMLFILFVFSLLMATFSFATDINMNLQGDNTNSNNLVSNSTIEQTNEMSNVERNPVLTNTPSTSISSVSSVSNEVLGLTNILNILLIVVGVVLILLGIAILIRMHS